MEQKQNNVPEARKRITMGLQTHTFRDILKKHPHLGDEWVKEQLGRIGKPLLFSQGIADAIRNGELSSEKTYLTRAKNVKPQMFMLQTTGDLRKILKKNPELGDEWVESQLKTLDKDKLFYPGIAQDIRNKRVGTEESYFNRPDRIKYEEENVVENPHLAEQGAKARGETTYKTITGRFPEVDRFNRELAQELPPYVKEHLEQMRTRTPFESNLEQSLQGLLGQYNQQYGQGLRGLDENPYAFEGPGVDAARNAYNTLAQGGNYLYEGARSGLGNLAGLAQNAYQGYMNRGQSAQPTAYNSPLENLEMLDPRTRMESQLKSINKSPQRRF